jgi:glycosyltransferase involved in cell wall biosynthesis
MDLLNRKKRANARYAKQHAKVAVVICCYGRYEMVNTAISRWLAGTPKDVHLVLVDNCSPDRATRSRLRIIAVAEGESRAHVIGGERNLGCHHGFTYGMKWAREHLSPTLSVKSDDDAWPDPEHPWDWERLLALFAEHPVAFAVPAYYPNPDNELSAMPIGSVAGFAVRRAETVLFPIGIFSAAWLHAVGYLDARYMTASGRKIDCDAGHLYGGEEAYASELARKTGMDYFYLSELITCHKGDVATDPDYECWKYFYGFVGNITVSYTAFRSSPALRDQCYYNWYAHPMNDAQFEAARAHFKDRPLGEVAAELRLT